MSTKLESPKKCPRCEVKGVETVANTEEELEVVFGLRRVPDGGKKSGKKKLIAQSHCRGCRSEQSRQRRAEAQRLAREAAEAATEESNE